MKSDDLIDMIGEASDEYVRDAKTTKMQVMPQCEKWSAVVYRKHMAAAACLVLFLALCGFGYAAVHHWGIGSADKVHINDLKEPFGTVAVSQGTQEQADVKFNTKSNVITDYTEVYADHSVCVELDDDHSIPSIYFSPNYMVIFTQDHESGWELSKNDEFLIDFSLLDKRRLEVGYIVNGSYVKITTGTGPDFGNSIIAQEDGIYYFCLTNRSSGNAVITSGMLSLK